jgi:hypothetical protein
MTSKSFLFLDFTSRIIIYIDSYKVQHTFITYDADVYIIFLV